MADLQSITYGGKDFVIGNQRLSDNGPKKGGNQNEGRKRIIKNFLKTHEDEIANIQSELGVTRQRQDVNVIIDAKKSLLRYVQHLTIHVEKLSNQLTCAKLQSQYQNIHVNEVNEVSEQVQLKVIQFIFKGQTHGRLN